MCEPVRNPNSTGVSSPMPDKPTIREQWQAYAKGACNLCGGGVERIHPFLSEPRHTVRNETVSCTAMTFEAWAGWRIERLTYALKACETFVMRVDLETYRELRDRALAAQPESGVTK